MLIPFPPGGPQVQAALQNPAQFPDQRLQQYAAGQPPQPTGQVMPGPLGPAGLELASRNAQRQAAGRAQAMQNNPQESPTVFQQKDREMAQQQQQLAAMQQQMQQKEQQFGLMGAMLAKKAQDLQARERGIAAIPMRNDIFTAMDGGIVFSNGGGVQRFDGTEDSFIDPARLSDPLGRFGGLRRKTPVPPALLAAQPAGTTRLGGIASQLKSDLFKAIEQSDEEKQRAAQLIELTQAKIEALKNSEMSAEDKTRLINDEVRRLENILGEYTTGRAARTEKARAAIEGEAPTFQQRMARGLANIPANISGMRLGQGLAMLAAGAGQADQEYARRQREAAKFQADSEEKFAQADMLAKMGFTEKARQLAAQAQTEKFALAKNKTEIIGAEQEGIAALQARDEKRRANFLDTLSRVATVGAQEEDSQRRADSAAAALQFDREKFAAAPDREAARLRLEAALKRDTDAARIRAEGATGGRTDLQIRAGVFYNVLKEENDKLPQGERKTDAQLSNQAYILAGNELYEARRTSAQANMLRAIVFASDTKQEALRKVEYLGLSEEEKEKLRKEINEKYPTSGTASPAAASPATASSGARLNPPPGVTPLLQRNPPPPPSGYVLNPSR